LTSSCRVVAGTLGVPSGCSARLAQESQGEARQKQSLLTNVTSHSPRPPVGLLFVLLNYTYSCVVVLVSALPQRTTRLLFRRRFAFFAMAFLMTSARWHHVRLQIKREEEPGFIWRSFMVLLYLPVDFAAPPVQVHSRLNGVASSQAYSPFFFFLVFKLSLASATQEIQRICCLNRPRKHLFGSELVVV
jgi:hypothetical protein